MTKKSTVTVAVCAYNEEKNIANFLKSVLTQKEDGFEIKKIVVISDGSTDQTIQKIKSINNSKIQLIISVNRIGKSSHLNDIYRDLNTDYLVQSDADVVFSHKNVARDIIQPLINNPQVGMVGGNPVPLHAHSFWEKVVSNAFEPYQKFRSDIRGGNNAFSAVGQILAYKKALLKSIKIPQDMVTNDLYTYFCCLSDNWQYRYVKSAIVYFQPPKILRDMSRQNTRFYSGYLRMFNYFDKDLVNSEMSIPKFVKYRALFKQFLSHPILSLVYVGVNICCEIYASFFGNKLNAKWPIAITTKKLNKINI